ncbi:MAG TPA: CHRD domain-containing protein [Rhodocyclaceae bacterium]|nr:CHRD domain-containing protein [Rhodocyclaceae bacterium]
MNTISRFGRPALLGTLAAAALAAVSISALADEVKLKLAGDQEVPPVATAASGSGTLTINSDMTVAGSVTTTGVAGTMAHIHLGKAGANGPVAVPLTKSGDNTWAVPAGAKLTEAQYQAYRAGETYVNVHSAEHKGGEIRGQLNPPMAAPMSRPGY